MTTTSHHTAQALDRLHQDAHQTTDPDRSVYARRVLTVAGGLANIRRGEHPCFCGWCGFGLTLTDIDTAQELVDSVMRAVPATKPTLGSVARGRTRTTADAARTALAERATIDARRARAAEAFD